ncbi:MAG: peptidase E [Dehalococcoidia bacterium]|nr:peptidase E [Dehalococcoidia bacterium]
MAEKKSQIILLGEFALSQHLYMLRQARSATPRVAFLATASGDSDAHIAGFYSAFSKLDCHPSHLPFFKRTPELRQYILEQDVIYVGGGNTKSMLAVWRDWGLSDILREAWQQGIVLTGTSAGAICWFEQGITDSYSERLAAIPCLGFLPGSCCPHYDSEPERRPSYHDLILKGESSAGLAVEDGVAVHFVERTMHTVVASKPGAKAYRVHATKGAVKEEALLVRNLEANPV